jgi:hypothetical protein
VREKGVSGLGGGLFYAQIYMKFGVKSAVYE